MKTLLNLSEPSLLKSDFYLSWSFSSEYCAHENAWKIYFVWKKKMQWAILSEPEPGRRQQQLRGITDRIIPVPVLHTMKELPSEITLNFSSNLNLTCESITFTDTFESANRGGFFFIIQTATALHHNQMILVAVLNVELSGLLTHLTKQRAADADYFTPEWLLPAAVHCASLLIITF